MDAAVFSKLAAKVTLKGFKTDETIFSKDSPSDFAYIILFGTVKVIFLQHFISNRNAH